MEYVIHRIKTPPDQNTAGQADLPGADGLRVVSG